MLRGHELHRGHFVARRAKELDAHRIRDIRRCLTTKLRHAPHGRKCSGNTALGKLGPPASKLGLTARCDRDHLCVELDANRDRITRRGVTRVKGNDAIDALRPRGRDIADFKANHIVELGKRSSAPCFVDHLRIAIDADHLERMLPHMPRTPREEQRQIRAPAPGIEQPLQATVRRGAVIYASFGGSASWLDRAGAGDVGALVTARAAIGTRIAQHVMFELGYNAFVLGGSYNKSRLDEMMDSMQLVEPRTIVSAGEGRGILDASLGLAF